MRSGWVREMSSLTERNYCLDTSLGGQIMYEYVEDTIKYIIVVE